MYLSESHVIIGFKDIRERPEGKLNNLSEKSFILTFLFVKFIFETTNVDMIHLFF